MHYNLGLALQQLGRRREARVELGAAQRLDPRDAATLYALAAFHAQDGDRPETLAWAARLPAIAPDDPEVTRLVAGLRAAP